MATSVLRLAKPASSVTTSIAVRCFSNAPTKGMVVLDYKDVMDSTKNLHKLIEEAYGFDGYGILAIRGVPGYVEARQQLLPLARKFANLPQQVKTKYEHPESFWSFGWSHGREKLEGRPDFSKGSYYANPQYDNPVSDPELIKKFPSFCHPNIWPNQEMPELRGAFLGMGNLIVNTGALLARHCDSYVHSKLPAYGASRLTDIIKTSRTAKGRLLYYFPFTADKIPKESDLSSWCGWHNDHGSLTGLTTALFHDADGKEIPSPENAGLFARSRHGNVVRVVPPPNCMMFQIGETAQIHSGGVLQATPHAVKGASEPGIGRCTFAVFMEPEWHEPMSVPLGTDQAALLRGARGELLPPGVPALATRWNNSMDFAKFTDTTLNAYY